MDQNTGEVGAPCTLWLQSLTRLSPCHPLPRLKLCRSLECVSGYGLNGTSADGCVPCIDDLCGDCSSAYTQCKSCSDMNWLSPDGTCQPVSSLCPYYPWPTGRQTRV